MASTPTKRALPGVYFSDVFGVPADVIERYGAFNISLITDLPLFIDPFLLFNSKRRIYQQLHEGIIKYLRFLRDKAVEQQLSEHLINAWYCFPEVKQTWLGFTKDGKRWPWPRPRLCAVSASEPSQAFRQLRSGGHHAWKPPRKTVPDKGRGRT